MARIIAKPAKTASLAKTPKRAVKTPAKATETVAVTEAPKPMAGSNNRYSYQSVSPQDAINLASLAQGLELDFGNDEKGMRKYRTRLYAINKEFSGKWRFRTIREASILMIWRLAY